MKMRELFYPVHVGHFDPQAILQAAWGSFPAPDVRKKKAVMDGQTPVSPC